MELNPHDALDRTALLIGIDLLHNQVTSQAIVDGLMTTWAQITATREELGSAAAQHALVTLALQLAMSGINIDLDIPNVPIVGSQPPLRGDRLVDALLEHLTSTWPWISLERGAEPDIGFVIGGSTVRSGDDIVVTGDREHLRVGPAYRVHPARWEGDWPISPIAAGLAAASLAVRAAVHRIAATAGLPEPELVSSNSVIIDLNVPAPMLSVPDIGFVPVISAGAITHGALFALLRVPGLCGHLEIFDADLYDVPNLNRYPLANVTDMHQPKAITLERYSTDDLTITGRAAHYRGGDRAGARRILVGADDIEIRWTAQQDVNGWLGIGATSHLFSEVSTHPPLQPCARCIHSHLDAVPETIPTISMISGWAGLHLANELLASLPSQADGRLVSTFPLGLGAGHSHLRTSTRFNPNCPRCWPAA